MSNLQVQIDVTRPEDAEPILEISRNVGVFSAEEVETVDELLGEYFSLGAVKSGYYFITGRIGEQVVGFACYGPRALTHGTFDLFWIATDKAFGKQGIGGLMLQRIAVDVKGIGGRLIVAETSSRLDYTPTRRFYETHHYQCEAVVADFYAPGDDLVMYIQRL